MTSLVNRGGTCRTAPSFSQCESCGEEIPAKRLAAVPDTRYCVRCAESKVLPVRASQNPLDPTGTDFVIVPGNLAERRGMFWRDNTVEERA